MKVSKRPRYFDLYNDTFKRASHSRGTYLLEQLRGVVVKPDALRARLRTHVHTLITTQAIGHPLYAHLNLLLMTTRRLLEIRRSIAARSIQRLYLVRLYRPPKSGGDMCFAMRLAIGDGCLVFHE